MRRRNTLLLAAVCALLFLLLWTTYPSPEPSVQGQPLSHWLDLYLKSDEGSADRAQAVTAVRAIGTRAIPHLLRWVSYTAEWKLALPADVTPTRWRIEWILREQFCDGVAPKGFRILGTNACAAIPQLTSLLNSKNAGDVPARAAECLGYLGPAALPPLLAALTNQDANTRRAAAFTGIPALGTNAAQAIPALIQLLASPDEDERQLTAAVLAKMRLEPSVVVPALAKRLDDPSVKVRCAAIKALGMFGTNSSELISRLHPLLDDREEFVRYATTNALHKIDSEKYPDPGLE